MGKGLDMLQTGPIEGYDVKVTGAKRLCADSEFRCRRDYGGSGAQAWHEPRRFTAQEFRSHQVGDRAGGQIFAQRDSGVGDESVGRDVLGRASSFGFPEEPRDRNGGRVGYGSVPYVYRGGIECFGGERDGGVVLGGHGDTMVPIVRLSSVSGIPLTELIEPAKLDAIVQRTRTGGAEIVKYLGTGSAYYAPAAAAVEMVESILKDKKKVLPCAVLLEGEYGINGLFVGVPVKLGAGGIEQIYEIKLTAEEKAMLDNSAAAVKEIDRRDQAEDGVGLS